MRLHEEQELRDFHREIRSYLDSAENKNVALQGIDKIGHYLYVVKLVGTKSLAKLSMRATFEGGQLEHDFLFGNNPEENWIARVTCEDRRILYEDVKALREWYKRFSHSAIPERWKETIAQYSLSSDNFIPWYEKPEFATELVKCLE